MMKTSQIYDASTYARSISKNFEIAVAMSEAGHEADAQYRVQIAHAALHSLADQLGYRIEPVDALASAVPPVFRHRPGLDASTGRPA